MTKQTITNIDQDHKGLLVRHCFQTVMSAFRASVWSACGFGAESNVNRERETKTEVEDRQTLSNDDVAAAVDNP